MGGENTPNSEPSSSRGCLPPDLSDPGHPGRWASGPFGTCGPSPQDPARARALSPHPRRPASTRATGCATSASPARARRTWRRWRPPPTWACPGAGRSESMMPRCAWGAAPRQVRGRRGRLRAPGAGRVRGGVQGAGGGRRASPAHPGGPPPLLGNPVETCKVGLPHRARIHAQPPSRVPRGAGLSHVLPRAAGALPAPFPFSAGPCCPLDTPGVSAPDRRHPGVFRAQNTQRGWREVHPRDVHVACGDSPTGRGRVRGPERVTDPPETSLL